MVKLSCLSLFKSSLAFTGLHFGAICRWLIAPMLLSAAALLALVGAIPVALLGQPEMYVAGNGSGAGLLRWFFDRSEGALPQAGVFSLPLWLYQLAILAWTLWLANALLNWLRWGWGCLGQGRLWPPRPPRGDPRGTAPEAAGPTSPP